MKLELILVVNLGVFVATFCICDFVLSHFSAKYAGFQDFVLRMLVLGGLLAVSLFMPILIQKQMNPEVSPLLFVVGTPLGMIATAVKSRLTKAGKMKWSGK